MAYGTNAPFGLKPLNSTAQTERLSTYYIPASADGATTYNANIFTGDLVVFNKTNASAGSGMNMIQVYVTNPDANGAGSSTADPVLGVFAGCKYTNAQGTRVESGYWPASTQVMPGSKIEALVYDDPNTIFEVQVSTYTNVLNDACFGLVTNNACNFTAGENFGVGIGGGGANLVPNNPAAGSTITKQSAMYLATKFTSNDPDHKLATLPLKVKSYSHNSQNQIYDADGKVKPFLNLQVVINNHVFKAGTLGVVRT